MHPLPRSSSAHSSFSEKEFYLAEFRGRSVGLALSAADGAELEELAAVIADLDANGTRTIVLGEDAAALERLCGKAVVDREDSGWLGATWHALASSAHVGLHVATPGGLLLRARETALRLRLAKLVWLDPGGGLRREQGGRQSYVDLVELERMLGSEVDSLGAQRTALLREVHELVAGGLSSVAICSPAGLADELFTYAGSGTFFTRERYIEVRALGLDEFDTAFDLIHRGVEEGYLVDRGELQLDQVLAHGFGVFVERRYLAGIGALLPHPAERAGELCSLYTLTRFAGGGVGGHLVAYALEQARLAGCDYVYACTTTDRVERFFSQHGFERVGPEAIPADKWEGYPAERRARVRCLRRDC
jgi:N-acetylglutamate synthase-like GNAT family acetyltransferase